jgi:hypothetical protein
MNEVATPVLIPESHNDVGAADWGTFLTSFTKAHQNRLVNLETPGHLPRSCELERISAENSNDGTVVISIVLRCAAETLLYSRIMNPVRIETIESKPGSVRALRIHSPEAALTYLRLLPPNFGSYTG